MKIITPIPNTINLACSGGIDSMFAYHFLTRGRRDVHCLFLNHGTETSDRAEKFLIKHVGPDNLTIGRISREKDKGESLEEYWRRERYNFFSAYSNVVTCHHLDDVIETWFMKACHGQPRVIPYRNQNVIRPFLFVKKSEIESYCTKYQIPYSQDMSNFDVRFPRNRIRHNIIPELLKINPGIHKTIAKVISEQIKESESRVCN